MQIIAMVGNKGGAGKTTLCVNLATALNAWEPTLVLDADPQQSSMQWSYLTQGKESLPVQAAVDDLAGAVEAARGDYAYVVLDCPPSVHSEQTRQALEIANLALIPVQPSPLDLWASVHIEEQIQTARATNPDLRAMLVINQLEPQTKLSRMMRQALDEFSLPAASTAVRRRVAYRSAVLEGRSVLGLGRRGEEAAEDIDALMKEVLKP